MEEKILAFAEKLKQEWDLAPRRDYSVGSGGGYSYRYYAYEVDIPYRKILQWIDESGLDRDHLTRVLERLKEEDLIVKYQSLADNA